MWPSVPVVLIVQLKVTVICTSNAKSNALEQQSNRSEFLATPERQNCPVVAQVEDTVKRHWARS